MSQKLRRRIRGLAGRPPHALGGAPPLFLLRAPIPSEIEDVRLPHFPRLAPVLDPHFAPEELVCGVLGLLLPQLTVFTRLIGLPVHMPPPNERNRQPLLPHFAKCKAPSRFTLSAFYIHSYAWLGQKRRQLARCGWAILPYNGIRQTRGLMIGVL